MRDYRRRKIDLELWKRAHLRNAPAGCLCVLCNPDKSIHDTIMERVKANTERIGEAPF